MPKTQYYAAASLDGFIATTDHSLDWLMQFGSLEGTSYDAFIGDVGALAMGASTYAWLLRELVKPGTGQAQPWPYTQPAWVFTSRTLPVVEGADIRFVRGDVVPVHWEMHAAANGRNVWIVGGGELAGQFLDAGLLDELIVQVMPVTLGTGLPLLPRRIVQPALKLTSAVPYKDTFVEMRYEVVRT
ncbi:dihydrofolate reductase family protein [Ralstonia soli]|uniref:Dihydrofolate reductase family protein n=1 Tax=Ralstonia soli TaxID=2953896 RepID=A0ABT1APT5_9RALS|nr:dihydrofolate reductase family protein [Ralstonia soli]MCO5400445.1 dihydrofolate reductase family protein [Ralstonia soli]